MQFTAKTVEDAVKDGLEVLEISEDQADIKILEEPVKGLFGKLKGKAVVEIVKKEGKSNSSNIVEFVEKIFDYLGLTAKATQEELEDKTVINVIAEKSSEVIGYRGELLDAIQTLAGAKLNINNKEYRKVVVDCENYRAKREETLINLAHKLEDKATEMKREVMLEPMSAFERRIIHTALAESSKVSTRSDGKEPNRYVVIVPFEKDEFSKPYNAGRNNNDRKHGKGFQKYGDKKKFNDNKKSSGFLEEKRKAPSGFGTYLGNSLKDKQ